MITYALITVVILVFILSLVFFRSVLSPAVLHSGMWATILALHTFVDHGLYSLSHFSLWIVVGSVLIFFISCLLVSFFPFRRYAAPQGTSQYWNAGLAKFHRLYFWVALAAAPLVWLKANALAAQGSTENFLVNLRMALIAEDGSGSYGALAYFLLVAFSGFFLRLVDFSSKVFSLGTVIYFLLCVYYATMATGRTFFFLLVIPSFVLLAIFRKGRSGLMLYILMLISLLMIFFLLGFLMGRAGEDAQGFLQVFWLYLLGGVTAFDYVLNNFSGSEGLGFNVFRSFIAVFSAIGFDWDVPVLIKGYVNVPAPTNVYTVFYPYYLDFGISFIIISQFLFAVFHQFFYSMAVSGSRWGLLIFSVSVYPLLMQWFQDQYFSLATTFVVFFALLTIPFLRIGGRQIYAQGKD